MKFAVQLYSLRHYINEHGIEDAFRIISEAGFEGVEFAGFYGKNEEEIKALLNAYNLKAVSAHVGADQIEQQISMFKALNITCPIIPMINFNKGVTYNDGRDILREAVAFLKNQNMNLGYHNHWHEFVDGQDVLSDLIRDIPSLKLEPDVFWLAVARIDSVDFINKHKENIIYLHIKELGEGGKNDANPIPGEGKANLASVLQLGKNLGIDWSILEVEKIDVPWDEYLKRSYTFMKKFK